MANSNVQYVWINGEFVEWEKATIHSATHSLHYAGAVFEGQRSYNGKIFKLEEHTERLLRSSNIMHMEVPYSIDEIIAANRQLVVKNNLKDSYIRPLVWRGSESIGLINKSLSINCLILAIHSRAETVNGLKLCISRWQKPSPMAVPSQAKSSGHYNMMIVADMEAKKSGYDDAILLDFRGYVAECTTTNIFFITEDDQLITPFPTSCLNGITRQTVIELANGIGLRVAEKDISLEDITKYKGCFITGTGAEVRGIGSVDIGNLVHIFKDNRITEMIQLKYQNCVGKI